MPPSRLPEGRSCQFVRHVYHISTLIYTALQEFSSSDNIVEKHYFKHPPPIYAAAMRYQDWDVLLFPSDEEAHVPVQEFRTACAAELSQGSPNPTSLLSTFVPSMQCGSPFHISVHSWAATKSTLGTLPNGLKLDEMWQVRVVIDGELVGIKLLPCDVSWPQIICKSLFDGYAL